MLKENNDVRLSVDTNVSDSVPPPIMYLILDNYRVNSKQLNLLLLAYWNLDIRSVYPFLSLAESCIVEEDCRIVSAVNTSCVFAERYILYNDPFTMPLEYLMHNVSTALALHLLMYFKT